MRHNSDIGQIHIQNKNLDDTVPRSPLSKFWDSLPSDVLLIFCPVTGFKNCHPANMWPQRARRPAGAPLISVLSPLLHRSSNCRSEQGLRKVRQGLTGKGRLQNVPQNRSLDNSTDSNLAREGTGVGGSGTVAQVIRNCYVHVGTFPPGIIKEKMDQLIITYP